MASALRASKAETAGWKPVEPRLGPGADAKAAADADAEGVREADDVAEPSYDVFESSMDLTRQLSPYSEHPGSEEQMSPEASLHEASLHEVTDGIGTPDPNPRNLVNCCL